MNLKIMDVLSTTLMGLGGLALGGFLVTHGQVAIGSALVGAVSSAWFLHHATSSSISALTQSQSDTVAQLLQKLVTSAASPASASSTTTSGSAGVAGTSL